MKKAEMPKIVKEEAEEVINTENHGYMKEFFGRIRAGFSAFFGLGKLGNVLYLVFFPVFVIYLEILTRSFVERSVGVTFVNYIYILLFSISAGLMLYVGSSLFKRERLNKIIANTLISLITLVYLIEIVARNSFNSFFGLDFLAANGGNMLRDYHEITFKVIVQSFGIILLFVVPLVLFNLPFISKRLTKKAAPASIKASALLLMVILHVVTVGIIESSTQSNGIPSDKGIYSSQYEVNKSVSRFGMFTTLRLEVKHLLFGKAAYKGGADDGGGDVPIFTNPPTSEATTATASSGNKPVSSTESAVTTPAVHVPTPQIGEGYDLLALSQSEGNKTLKDMNEYFAGIEPTMTNDYTGIFAGKNIIFLTLEAYTPFLVSEELTPTLYMMMNSGFVFENFYQPAWGGSTSSGEFSALMGLFPDSGQAMQNTIGKDLSFTIGNRLLSKGYTSYAFHGNNHEYYKRHLTHKALGYSEFIAPGSGLNNLAPGWPGSDKDLLEKTLDYYIDKQPFSVYYMTLSGHSVYTRNGNAMASRNWEKVQHLPYSEAVKAYIACNLELEYAMEYLIQRLEEEGILEDTVIVATNDHYPYGLEPPIADRDYIPELIKGDSSATLSADERAFELYRSTFFLWSASVKKQVVVTKPGYTLDILPTVLNLFGETYDSRIFTGRDLLSDTPGIAIFPNYSWISEVGSYNSATGIFTPNPEFEGKELGDYVSSVSKVVKNRIAYGKSVQQNDYFRYLNGL
ncbi:MAG: LTA synthase family protein [Oscillospiraceae bacterium]|nr:LTA synthase family protein [Oscillospiraceae bacterium]